MSDVLKTAFSLYILGLFLVVSPTYGAPKSPIYELVCDCTCRCTGSSCSNLDTDIRIKGACPASQADCTLEDDNGNEHSGALNNCKSSYAPEILKVWQDKAQPTSGVISTSPN